VRLTIKRRPVRMIRQALLLAVAAAAGSMVGADELHLKNGSILVGTLVSADEGNVVFDTPFAGKIPVKKENIARLITSEPVTVKTTSGEVLRERTITATEDQMVAAKDGEVPVTLTATEIALINPAPWQLGDGFNWSGLTSAAMQAKRGNSDSDQYNLAARSIWRSLQSRYTINGFAEFEESNGEEISDNWTAQFKYDRFLKNPDNYVGAAAKFEYDKFADLDLRTTVGPYLGRQFLDKPVLSLQGELGPVWVDENFNEAEDNDFAGMLWDFAATSNVIGFGTTLYLEHDGTLNFDDPDNLILNTVAGLRMPLIFGFETKVEARWEYNGGAVEGVDDLDSTYTFGIGYSW
jgi:putative salt-induced outer membrane protein YdiY/small nuclear ribonucleoprotein (snRNP)-like protein